MSTGIATSWRRGGAASQHGNRHVTWRAQQSVEGLVRFLPLVALMRIVKLHVFKRVQGVALEDFARA